jgi:hypothetical protein
VRNTSDNTPDLHGISAGSVAAVDSKSDSPYTPLIRAGVTLACPDINVVVVKNRAIIALFL